MILFRGPRLLLCAGPYYTVTIVLYDHLFLYLYMLSFVYLQVNRVGKGSLLDLKMEADHDWSPDTRLQGCAG